MKLIGCPHDGCVWTLLVDDDKSKRTRDAHCWDTHRCVGEHRLASVR